ncbi:hypothetical protein ACFVS2_20815 [Brevibacillus sp. NPDC058079]|uniref:hypothetical protein n=1 Tax=Brevibacillus sp. NPDC058079 TaxID=3346330 RepID=UPI0036EFC2D5
MNNLITAWHNVVLFVSGLTLWQWIIIGFVFLFLFKKPLKRFVKRQMRKVKKLIMQLVRLYFIGM